jgi:hypothetical protein
MLLRPDPDRLRDLDVKMEGYRTALKLLQAVAKSPQFREFGVSKELVLSITNTALERE